MKIKNRGEKSSLFLCLPFRVTASRATFSSREKVKSFRLFPFPQAQNRRTIKNVLRFELHFSFCFGKAEGAEKLCLELLQVVFQEDVPPELLSFVLYFQKRKYINAQRSQISQRRARGNEHSLSHGFVVPAHPLLGEACKGASLPCISPP